MTGSSRRAFLAGAATVVAAVVVGGGAACGSSTDGATAEAEDRVEVDPEHPPKAPELDDDQPKYVESARAFLVLVPPSIRARAHALVPPEVRAGLERSGLLALSDVCPKDRIQLPLCRTSGWFECPACGSQFDGLGDTIAGPAVNGMTLHPITIDDGGNVVIAAKQRVPGLPRGIRLVDQPALGPHCA